MSKDNSTHIQSLEQELQLLKNRLKDKEEQLLAIAMSASDAIVMMDDSGCVSFWNSAAELIYGYSSNEAMGKNVHDLLAPVKYKSAYEKGIPHFFKTGRGPAVGKTLVLDALTKDCRIIPVELSVTAVQIREKWHAVAISRDISERLAVEKRLFLDKAVIKSADEAILITDKDASIIDINPAFTTITGYEREDVIGKKPSVLSSGKHDSDFYQAMWHKLLSEGKWSGELWNRRKSGETYIEWLSITSIVNDEGLQNYIGIFSDISERKEVEAVVKRQANVDVLTNILNRRAFIGRLDYTLEICRRKSQQAALLFIDIDKFKEVNDTLGHLAGDLLLQEITKRLKQCVRGSDTLSRFGGDEFAVLLYDIAGKNKVAGLAQKICSALKEPYKLGDDVANVSASIGIALYPGDALEGEKLIELSDEAMYRVKNSTRDGYAFYSLDCPADDERSDAGH